MGKHPILTRVHVPKQVPDFMGFAHHENSADLCATDVKEQMHSPSVFLHDWRKKNHPFMTKQLPAGWTCLKKSYADSTECIERELITLLLEAMGFVYNEDNADFSSAHVKDIANRPVQ